MKNFKWNLTLLVNQPLIGYQNLVFVYDHEKILNRIDEKLESMNSFEESKKIIEQIKNK
jgi:hypothetical protein